MIQVQIRKDAVVVLTESLLQRVLEQHAAGEQISVMIFPGAKVAVLEDGSTAEEIRDTLASAASSSG